MEQGNQAIVKMEAAFSACQKELPAILKTLKRKKAGGSVVPFWQEPSTILLEWALNFFSKEVSIALHLSNLQKMKLEPLQESSPSRLVPRVPTVVDTRELYVALSQSSSRIEEVLTKFAGGGLVIWAPEGKVQLPRIVAALKKLYEGGVKLSLHMLVEFSPLPACVTAESILDLWSHPIMYDKSYATIVQNILFLRETSKCVFTRDDNPLYAFKNVVLVSLQVNSGGAIPVMSRAVRGEDFIEMYQTGDYLYIDVPLNQEQETRKVLTQISAGSSQYPAIWNEGFRSKGSINDFPRETIVGHILTDNDFESQAVCKSLIAKFRAGAPHLDALIGRQSLFGNKHAILYDGTPQQLEKLNNSLGRVFLGESVLVTPGRSLCIPFVEAEAIGRVLTEDESLQATQFRYRKSGPMEGAVFCKAKAIREHVAARKKLAYATRQPGPEADRLQRQVQIEALRLDAQNYTELPHQIMQTAGELNSVVFTHQPDSESELALGEYKLLQRDGHWNGRILIQCPVGLDIGNFFKSVHGRNICLNKAHTTLAMTSTVQDNLAASLFTAATSSQ